MAAPPASAFAAATHESDNIIVTVGRLQRNMSDLLVQIASSVQDVQIDRAAGWGLRSDRASRVIWSLHWNSAFQLRAS